MKFKRRFKLGMLVAIPAFFFVFLGNIVLGTFKVWYPVLDFFKFPNFLYTPLSIICTLLFVYAIGVLITARWVDWLLSRLPIVRKLWNPLKSMADRIAFAAQGGYKIVMYNGYHKGTVRERPGIVLGKVRREYADGTTVTRLVVMQPPPNVFDSYLMPYKDTEILEGDPKDLILYMFSGGIINPPVIKTRAWTSQEYKEIPDLTKSDQTEQDN